jgi:hypothetical protein
MVPTTRHDRAGQWAMHVRRVVSIEPIDRHATAGAPAVCCPPLESIVPFRSMLTERDHRLSTNSDFQSLMPGLLGRVHAPACLEGRPSRPCRRGFTLLMAARQRAEDKAATWSRSVSCVQQVGLLSMEDQPAHSIIPGM